MNSSSRALGAVLLLALGASPQCWSGEVTTWTSSLTVPGKSIQVFPRSQCHKYFNFLNVLHWWNDRPLIYDRSLRPAIVDGVLVTPGTDVLAVRNSLVRDAELAKEYLVDGLGSFGSTDYQEPSYEFYLDSVAASATAPLLIYTPTTGFTGVDSFTFTAHDGVATSASATISITVAIVPPPPGGSGGGSDGGGGGGGCGLGGSAAALLFLLGVGVRRRRW